MTEVLKVRDSDGKVVGHYPDMTTAEADDEAGYTLRELAEGEEYNSCCVYSVVDDVLEVDLSIIKADHKKLLAEVRDNVILATVTTDDYGEFYCDDKTKLLLAGKVIGILLMESMGLTPPATVKFKRVDGWHTFDLADFKAAALQVLGCIEAVFDQQEALEDDVDGAGTRDDVQEINWEV